MKITHYNGENIMTLVQASIADNGNSVILIADRLLTRMISPDVPSYEFEWTEPKIVSQGKVGVGFAGSALYTDIARARIAKMKDFDAIIEGISNCIIEERDTIIEKQIKRLTGISSKEFFENPQYPIPPDVREFIYGQIGQLDLLFQCIVAGYDKDKEVKLVTIDSQGNIYQVTEFKVISIGTGQPFSQIYFDLYDYKITVSETDGLFFSYKAKKWAEAPTGVGSKTDILILRKNGESLFIINESELMEQINILHRKELKERATIRKSLIEELQKKSNGALK